MVSHPKYLYLAFGVLCLIWTASPLCSAADLSVSGMVLDQTGSPIPGAFVTLYTSTALLHKTQSANDGSFSFPNVQAGTYLLECHQDGFQTQSRRLVLRDRSEYLRIALDVVGLHQHVSVVASDLPEVPSEIAKAVSLISAEEITNRDLFFLTDALRSIPSLQIQQLGGPGALSSYRFRGMRPEDSAILLDGFRFLDASDIKGSARPLLSDLSVTRAERIEVLRGAASTLYGTNAVGGVVNVISRQPSQPLAGFVSLEGGSLGLLQGAGGLEGLTASRRFSYSIAGTHVNYTRGLDGRDTYRNSSGNSRFTYDFTPQARLFLRFHLADSFLFLNRSPSPLPDLPPLPPGQLVRHAVPFPRPGANFHTQFDDPDNHGSNRSYGVAARFDHTIGAFWSYAVGYQTLQTRSRFDNGPAVSPEAQQFGFIDSPRTSSFEGTLDELFWRNQFALHPANTAQLNLGFESSSLHQTAFDLTTQATQRSLAFTAADHTRLLDQRLHLQLVFRGQWYGLDSPQFSDPTADPFTSVSDLDLPATYSGDISLAYFLARWNTKVRLHGGNGFRSPSLFERFGSGGSGDFRSYFGNPLLRAERSTFIDGGFDWFAFGNKMEFSATYFYNHLQTIIDFGVTPNDPFSRQFGYMNLKGGNSRGFELSVSSRPLAFLNFTGSYTFTKSNQPSPTSAGTTRVLGLSDHQVNFTINARPTRLLNLNLQAYAVSNYDFPVFGLVFSIPSQTYRFPGYALLNLTGSYILLEAEHARLRFTTRIDNLLNQEYFQSGFWAPKAVVRTGIHVDF